MDNTRNPALDMIASSIEYHEAVVKLNIDQVKKLKQNIKDLEAKIKEQGKFINELINAEIVLEREFS